MNIVCFILTIVIAVLNLTIGIMNEDKSDIILKERNQNFTGSLQRLISVIPRIKFHLNYTMDYARIEDYFCCSRERNETFVEKCCFQVSECLKNISRLESKIRREFLVHSQNNQSGLVYDDGNEMGRSLMKARNEIRIVKRILRVVSQVYEILYNFIKLLKEGVCFSNFNLIGPRDAECSKVYADLQVIVNELVTSCTDQKLSESYLATELNRTWMSLETLFDDSFFRNNKDEAERLGKSLGPEGE